jgi:hypothetical protein
MNWKKIMDVGKPTQDEIHESHLKHGGKIYCQNCHNIQTMQCGTKCQQCGYQTDEKIRELEQQQESLEIQEKYKEAVKKKIQDAYEIQTKKLEKEFSLKRINLEKEYNEKTNDEYMMKLPEIIQKAVDVIKEENRRKEIAEQKKKKKINDEFMGIIKFIKSDFEVSGKIHDEDALQNQLIQVLGTKFGKGGIEQEQPLKNGDIVDILINKKFVIELKIPENRTALRNLYGQLKEYMDEFENICVFILDIDSLNKETIQHYVKRYKDDFGIESIVKKGQKKGQKIEDKNSKIV